VPPVVPQHRILLYSNLVHSYVVIRKSGIGSKLSSVSSPKVTAVVQSLTSVVWGQATSAARRLWRRVHPERAGAVRGPGVIVAHIFISYATPDRPVADEISRWLRAAGHEPFLDHDLRDGISVGERWKQRLYRELHEVDAVIGVVTSSFVASTWCEIEVGIADALGCRLIPVRAEASMVHPLMRDLQYADYQADRQQAHERVLQAVRLLGVGGGAWGEGKNPFPGLEPFTAELSRVFFGRAGEAREVSNRLRAMGSASGILAIVGSSGCGKSSLVNAAVMPLVDSDPTWLAVPTLVPGTDPLPELARMLAATATRLKLSWSASDVRGRLEAGTDGLRRVADDLLAAGPVTPRRLLITIDQAEELFNRTTSDARQRFAQLLREGGVPWTPPPLTSSQPCALPVPSSRRLPSGTTHNDLRTSSGMPSGSPPLLPRWEFSATVAAATPLRLPSSSVMTRPGRSSTPPAGMSTPSRSANGDAAPAPSPCCRPCCCS
jgi:TIR domain